MRINILLNMGTRKDSVYKVVEECLSKHGIKLLNVKTTKLDTGARFMLFTTSAVHRNDLQIALNEISVGLRGKIAEMRVF